MYCVYSYLLVGQDSPSNEQEITLRSSESKTGSFVFSPHVANDAWSAGVCANKEESDPGKDDCHVHQVAGEQHVLSIHLPVSVKVIQHRVNIQKNHVAKCTLRMVVGPGVIVKTKDQSGEALILVRRHLAIMPCLIVEFSASRGGFTIIECG